MRESSDTHTLGNSKTEPAPQGRRRREALGAQPRSRSALSPPRRPQPFPRSPRPGPLRSALTRTRRPGCERGRHTKFARPSSSRPPASPRGGRSASARPAATSAALRRPALAPAAAAAPPAPPSPAPSRPPALPGPVPTDLRPRAAAGRRRAAGSAGTRGPGGERVARGRPIPRSRQLGSSGAARQKGARGGCRARSRAPHVACRPAAGKRRGQRTAGGRECSGCGVNAAEMPAGRNGRTNTRIAYIFPFAPGGGARRKGRTEGPQPSEQPWRAQHRGSPQAAAAGAHGADSSRRYSAPGPAAFPSKASRATSARSARALPCCPANTLGLQKPRSGRAGGSWVLR